MAVINVLCPGCKARFTVSEKFAGKKGPCPKCKAQITIPEKAEDIKVHAPETFGPKDSKGRATLQPIFREERKFNPAIAAGIGGAVVLVFALAYLMRFNYPKPADKEQFPWLFLVLGAMVLAPPLVYGGYQVLRDDELEPHRGQSLWTRVAICSVIYAGIWGLLWGLVSYLPFGSMTQEIYFVAIAFAGMTLLGGGAAFVSFDLEYMKGIMHYGFYLLVTVLLRVAIGLSPLIGPFKD